MNETALSIILSGETLRVLPEALVIPDRFDWEMGRHCNAEYELHIILSGSCILDLDDQIYHLSAGNAIVIAPNHFHSASQVTSSFERLTVSLVAEKDSNVAALLYKLSALPVFRLTEEQLSVCRHLLQEANTTQLYHSELTRAYLLVLIAGVLRLALPDHAAEEDPWRQDKPRLYNIIDNYFAEFPVGSEQVLANKLHLSRRQLGRILQQYYGMSFREKFMHAKMDYTAWLLRTTNNSVGEIAHQVGYTTESSLFSSFKKYFGVTPKKYRLTYSGKRLN